MALNSQIYSENGVSISKEKIIVGDKVTLTYNGLLVKSGADNIIAHIGYGELWDEKAFIPMDLIDGIFKTTFKISQFKDLNISFKDSAENWDNNSQINYTYNVYEKPKAIKKADSPKQVKKTVNKTESKKEVVVKKKVQSSKSKNRNKT